MTVTAPKKYLKIFAAPAALAGCSPDNLPPVPSATARL